LRIVSKGYDGAGEPINPADAVKANSAIKYRDYAITGKPELPRISTVGGPATHREVDWSRIDFVDQRIHAAPLTVTLRLSALKQ
jgi:hypothetical protein